MGVPSYAAPQAALVAGLEGVVQDAMMLKVASHLLNWSVQIEQGKMRDPGTVEILRLAAKAIIGSTERVE